MKKLKFSKQMNRNADVKAHLQGDQRHGMDDGDLFEGFSQRAIAHNRNRNHFLDKGFDYDNLKLP
jgi:hypothetical protein